MPALGRLTSTLRRLVPTRNTVRDTPRRAEYYDGSEKRELAPPTRYARGRKAVPAPPPTGG